MTKTQGEIREILVEGQRLLKAGQYDEARRVLKPVRWHPTVQKWLESIPPESHHLRKLLIVALIAAVVIGVLVVAKINADMRPQNLQTCLTLQAAMEHNLDCYEKYR
jgi:hypothetical protein